MMMEMIMNVFIIIIIQNINNTTFLYWANHVIPPKLFLERFHNQNS